MLGILYYLHHTSASQVVLFIKLLRCRGGIHEAEPESLSNGLVVCSDMQLGANAMIRPKSGRKQNDDTLQR